MTSEKLGYVERAPDPEDGRAKVIRLTEEGAEARDTALEYSRTSSANLRSATAPNAWR